MDSSAMDVDVLDLSALKPDAAQFSSLPGVPSDAATKQFLDRYPLPVLFSALEAGEELESLMVHTLEKIFDTPFGASAILQSLPYAGPGLAASSSSTRRMTCLALSKFLESGGDDGSAVHALTANNLVLPLLKTIADGDAAVASCGAAAVRALAKNSIGIELLFAEKGAAAGNLKDLAIHGSSLVRIRIFSIVASLFGQSKEAVSAIKESGILWTLEEELNNTSDVLAQLNALELLYEISMTPEGARFLSEGGFIHQLIIIMGSNKVDPMVRSQSMMIGARLISPEGCLPSPVSKDDAMMILRKIDTTLIILDEIESSEKEAAIDALGCIGMSKQGAELLLQNSTSVFQHIVKAAFSQKGDHQLVGIHALASVVGSERTETPLLSDQAEICLKDLIFLELERLSKWSLSDLVLSLLQQAPEKRLAAYRLIVPLAARSWFLRGICSNKDVISFLTDPHVESSKEGMEWRHACCVAICSSLESFIHRTDASLQEVVVKFQEAVKMGPFLTTREKHEAQPMVVTQERF